MFNFGLSTICIIIEMKMGASGMLLRLAFDYRFSRLIKERLKRQCSKPYSYFTKDRSEITLVLACLQENDKVSINQAMAKIFDRDPFNSVCFSEDPVRNTLRKRALFLSRLPTSIKGGTEN